MKNEKNLMQMVIAGLLSVLIVVLVLGRGERVVIVNEGGYKSPPVVSSSVVPRFGDSDPDWWQHTIPFNNGELEEENIYCIKEVTKVFDGDTFEAVLEWDEETADGTVRIRLAGVNCPERFDQNCWLEALDFTTDYLFEIDENGNRRTTKDLRIQILAEDKSRERFVGLVFNKNQTNEDVKNTLGYELLENGLALPCFSYLVEYKITDYMLHYLDAVEKARKNFTWRSKSTKTSVWGAPEDYPASSHKDLIDIDLNPMLSSEIKDVKNDSLIHNGDIITIEIDSDNYIDAIDKYFEKAEGDKPNKYFYRMSGYSVMDESSSAKSRFFLPTTNLECYKKSAYNAFENEEKTFRLPYLRVFSGSPDQKCR